MMFLSFKSFISPLVLFKILLAHNVPAIFLGPRYVLPRLPEVVSTIFQCKICPAFFVPLILWLHLCLEVSLLDIQWKVYTFFPLSRGHLQRVLGVWLQYIHCSVVLVLTAWDVAFPRVFIGHCLILCKKTDTGISERWHLLRIYIWNTVLCVHCVFRRFEFYVYLLCPLFGMLAFNNIL